MNFYRNLLWWLLLAALGALMWEWLTPDLGEVLIRWKGTTITTTVAFALIAWALLWFFLWGLWSVLRLPFRAWKRLAQRQARSRLVNGLMALHEGHYHRAENLLIKAAEDLNIRTVALLTARKAAVAREDFLAAATHQAALAKHDPLAAALALAEMLLTQKKPQEVLEVLQPYADKKTLPPRGQMLYDEASRSG